MTKTLEELIQMGGKFYTICGDSWCDTAIYSWKFNPTDGLYHRYE